MLGALMGAVHALLAVGLALCGLALVAPPFPWVAVDLVVGGLGLLCLALAFAVHSGGRPRASWLAAGALVLALALPVLPYDERRCSDVPKPFTMDFCDEGGRSWRALGWGVLVGRAWGQGDLGSVSWRTTWWGAALVAAWLLAFAAVAGRWRWPSARRPRR